MSEACMEVQGRREFMYREAMEPCFYDYDSRCLESSVVCCCCFSSPRQLFSWAVHWQFS